MRVQRYLCAAAVAGLLAAAPAASAATFTVTQTTDTADTTVGDGMCDVDAAPGE